MYNQINYQEATLTHNNKWEWKHTENEDVSKVMHSKGYNLIISNSKNIYRRREHLLFHLTVSNRLYLIDNLRRLNIVPIVSGKDVIIFSSTYNSVKFVSCPISSGNVTNLFLLFESGRITADFGKECETKTGQAYIIDQLYV